MNALPEPTSHLTPDLDEARRFLNALAPGETNFTFQTFADDKKNKTPGLTKVLPGTFDEYAQQLADLNARGAGVFVTVNRTNGRGRETTDIIGVRAVYADFDGVPLTNADKLYLKPHIIVESSPDRWHVYYRTQGVTIDLFTRIQKKLIELFQSDPAVHDLPRVMRLPGFLHQKGAGEPFRTRIRHVEPHRPAISRSELATALAGVCADNNDGDPAALDGSLPLPSNVLRLPQTEERETALRWADAQAQRSHDEPGSERHGIGLDLGWRLKEADVSREVATTLAARRFAEKVRQTDSDGAPGPYTVERAASEIANAYNKNEQPTPRKGPPDASSGQKPKKRHLNNHASTMDVLRTDPNLRDVIRYDEMLREVILAGPIPGGRFDKSANTVRTDQDVSVLQEYLQRNGRPELAYDTLWKAVEQRARENSFHPVRNYLTSLIWDGVERLPFWMGKFLGAEDTEYVRMIGPMFVIALVARVFKPGCKMDHMVVLEGPQGATKSTACRILGGEWFSDSLPAINDGKEVSIHLKGCWLIEISELSAMNKADTEDLKHFVARQEERYRPPFGRATVMEPRQCVFIGTTNKSEYLRDETGGRRFWPVRVADCIDTDGLREARDQLFAEAVVRYKRGEAWWPDRDVEARVFKPEQDARFEADAWEEQITCRLTEDKPERVTIADVIAYVGLDVDRQHAGHYRRAGAILDRLGWEKASKRGTGGIRWWVPGPRWVPQGRPGGAAAAAKEAAAAEEAF